MASHRAQVGEARRVGDGVDLGSVQPTLGVDADLVGLHPPGDVAQSAVQVTGLVVEEGVRVGAGGVDPATPSTSPR